MTQHLVMCQKQQELRHLEENVVLIKRALQQQQENTNRAILSEKLQQLQQVLGRFGVMTEVSPFTMGPMINTEFIGLEPTEAVASNETQRIVRRLREEEMQYLKTNLALLQEAVTFEQDITKRTWLQDKIQSLEELLRVGRFDLPIESLRYVSGVTQHLVMCQKQQELRHLEENVVLIKRALQQQQENTNRAILSEKLQQLQQVLGRFGVMTEVSPFTMGPMINTEFIGLEPTEAVASNETQRIVRRLREEEMQYLKTNLALLQEAVTFEQDITKRTWLQDKIQSLEELLRVGHFDLPIESLRYVGGVTQHLVMCQKQQELRHLEENVVLIKRALQQQQENTNRAILSEKLQQLQQVLGRFGVMTEVSPFTMGPMINTEFIGLESTEAVASNETQRIVRRLREEEMQYLKTNLALLQEAVTFEQDITKRTWLQDKIQSLEELLRVGHFDLPIESLRYVGGVTQHLVMCQKQQELRHLEENVVLIKRALQQQQENTNRAILSEKLQQLQQVLGRFGVMTEVSPFTMGLMINTEFIGLEPTEAVASNETQRIVRRLWEEEMQYLKTNLALLQEAVTFEQDMTKRTWLQDKIQSLEELLRVGYFDLPIESLGYVGGVTQHLVMCQKQQELRHLEENVVLIKRALQQQQENTNRAILSEKLQQLQQVLGRFGVMTEVSPFTMEPMINTEFIGLEPTEAVASNETQRIVRRLREEEMQYLKTNLALLQEAVTFEQDITKRIHGCKTIESKIQSLEELLRVGHFDLPIESLPVCCLRGDPTPGHGAKSKLLQELRHLEENVVLIKRALQQQQENTNRAILSEKLQQLQQVLGRFGVMTEVSPFTMGLMINTEFIGLEPTEAVASNETQRIVRRLREEEMQYLKTNLALLQEAVTFEQDMTKRTWLQDKIQSLEELLRVGHFDLPIESLRYVGGVTQHLVMCQKQQELRHLEENVVLIKRALQQQQENTNRAILSEKLQQLQQVLGRFGVMTEVSPFTMGLMINTEFIGLEPTEAVASNETQRIVRRLREEEMQYLKTNLALLQEAVTFEQDITKRTWLQDKIQSLEELLRVGYFDLPIESLRYVGGVTQHLVMCQKQQELRHLEENVVLIKRALQQQQENTNRAILSEKLQQLQQVLGRFGVMTEVSPFTIGPMINTEFIGLEPTEAVASNETQRIVRRLREEEMQYLKTNLALLQEAVTFEQDMTKCIWLQDKIQSLEELLRVGHFDLPIESLRYVGGVTQHLVMRQKQQELRHLEENVVLIKRALQQQQENTNRAIFSEKLQQLQQVLGRFGVMTEVSPFTMELMINTEFIGLEPTEAVASNETQRIVRRLREEEMQYLKTNLALLQEAVTFEQDITKRIWLQDKIQSLEELLRVGHFDLPIESLRYVSGVTQHLVMCQKQQELRHLEENVVLIKRALQQQQENTNRAILSEKLQQLQQVLGRFGVITEVSPFTMGPMINTEFIGLESTEAVASNETQRIVRLFAGRRDAISQNQLGALAGSRDIRAGHNQVHMAARQDPVSRGAAASRSFRPPYRVPAVCWRGDPTPGHAPKAIGAQAP